MDPIMMTAVLRALDVGFAIATYYFNRAESIEEQRIALGHLTEINELKRKAEAREITFEEFEVLSKDLVDQITAPMRAAISRL